jgi:hypothetical protein
MSHDPNAQFDDTVMEMIEHSPTGSVPNTPAYQDALIRLYAAHKVYANADHKDGHVTARSLAVRPNFHAGNIEALMAGAVQPDALESNSRIFDRYVRSLPFAQGAKAEGLRVWVAGRPALHRSKHVGTEKLPVIHHDLVHTLFLVPGAGPHPGLPGNYLYGFVLQLSSGSNLGSWGVHLHDRDDGAALFDASTMQEALGKFQEVLESAPFSMNELEALGFRFN